MGDVESEGSERKSETIATGRDGERKEEIFSLQMEGEFIRPGAIRWSLQLFPLPSSLCEVYGI